MTEYDNTNRGAFWPNDRTREGKQDPQFTGSMDVEGVGYWISGWKRRADAKPGAPSLSFTIKQKEPTKAARSANPQTQVAPVEDFSDSIPFN